MFTRRPASETESRVASPLPQPRMPTPVPPVSQGSGGIRNETVDPLHEEGWVVIGKGTRVHGKIGDCRRLDVHGILEADVVADLLVVREGGGIKGTVQSDNARILGVFEGTLVVHDHLEIASTGHVTGDVSYRTLAIQAGARLRGNIVCSEPDADAEADIAPGDDARGNVISLPGMFGAEPGGPDGVANGYANGHANGSVS
jgi:cytoskeletal protein CcmA (bactofilin family)